MKPIIFNTEMVRAILDGRKTVTRRVVKCSHRDAAGFNIVKNGNGEIVGVMDYDDDERSYEDYTIPPYRPGDILYVRETWARVKFGVGDWHYEYRADCDNPSKWSNGSIAEWHPSIHMPKEAARIFLRVTGVRVERLQDITDEDIVAEGLPIGCYFDDLWDKTVKPADRGRYGWKANPLVWVIEFERCEKPEDEP